MPRASRDEARRHRDEVLTAAARLAREHGAEKVTVPQVMQAAGLTHGGFYRHFTSKDDLIAQAATAAFAERAAALDELLAEGRSREDFLTAYLSLLHRDRPGRGCAAAALALDAARAEPGDALHDAYAEGLRALIEGMTRLAPDEDEDHALVELSTIVGALLLSRASAGTDLSERFLSAVRNHLISGGPGD